MPQVVRFEVAWVAFVLMYNYDIPILETNIDADAISIASDSNEEIILAQKVTHSKNGPIVVKNGLDVGGHVFIIWKFSM
jgi:hypothetical protein